MELHEDSKEGLPPVKAKVTLGKEDLSIKVNPTHTTFLLKKTTTLNFFVSLPGSFFSSFPRSSSRSVTEEEEFL